MIGRYLCCAPEGVAFVYGPHGKPALAANSGLQFNVAHSHRVGLFAFAEDAAVGVGIEYVRAIEHEALAARFFSPAECAALEHVPSHDREEAFFSCWTRKEAYVKALGGGLSVPLDRFDVPVVPEQGLSRVVDRGEPDESAWWEAHDIAVGRGFRGALAVQRHDTRIHVWEVPVPTLRE